MRIVALHERPDLLEETAALLQKVWPGHYGPGGPGNALADLTGRARAEGLPCGLIALDDRGSVAGTVALSATSYGSRINEIPWLTGLCVRSDLRGQGIGSALVSAISDLAAAAGHGRIFTTTDAAAGLMDRLGWITLRQLEGPWLVMQKALR